MIELQLRSNKSQLQPFAVQYGDETIHMNRLTHFPLCPHSRSIRAVLGELRIEHELQVELPWAWRKAFLAMNPGGNLPVLELQNHMILCGAYPISEYLAEEQREADAVEPPLFPGDIEERAEARRLVDWFHIKCHSEVTRDLLYEKHYARAAAVTGHSPDSEVLIATTQNLKQHMRYIGFLTDYRRWLAGDEMSFADFAAAGHVSCLDYLGVIDWDKYPSARDWYVRIKSRRSFQGILDDRVPGLAPPQHYDDPDF
jgi:glutathione S-transferase